MYLSKSNLTPGRALGSGHLPTERHEQDQGRGHYGQLLGLILLTVLCTQEHKSEGGLAPHDHAVRAASASEVGRKDAATSSSFFPPAHKRQVIIHKRCVPSHLLPASTMILSSTEGRVKHRNVVKGPAPENLKVASGKASRKCILVGLPSQRW